MVTLSDKAVNAAGGMRLAAYCWRICWAVGSVGSKRAEQTAQASLMQPDALQEQAARGLQMETQACRTMDYTCGVGLLSRLRRGLGFKEGAVRLLPLRTAACLTRGLQAARKTHHRHTHTRLLPVALCAGQHIIVAQQMEQSCQVDLAILLGDLALLLHCCWPCCSACCCSQMQVHKT